MNLPRHMSRLSGSARRLAMSAAALLFLPLQVQPVAGQSVRVELPQVQRALPAGGTDTGLVPDSQPVPAITIELKRSAAQQADLESFLADVASPHLAGYHKWMTPAQFAARFAPDPTAVQAWLQAQGFTIGDVAAGGMRLTASGTAAQAAHAFGVRLHRYATTAGDLVTVDGTVSVPAPVAASIRSVSGLDGVASGTDPVASLAASVDAGESAILTSDLASVSTTAEQLASILEQASAEGQTVILLHTAPGLLPSRALAVTLSANPASVNDKQPTTPRPDWQSAPGLPADGLRYGPDAAVGADTSALTTALQTIVAKAGVRQGEVAATFYKLAPKQGVFTHEYSTMPAGTWTVADGLGTVNADALVKAWPYGVTPPSSSTIALSTHTITHGSNITLTATISSNNGEATPTGTVTFGSAQGGTLTTVNLDASGIATYTTNTLPGGQYGFYGSYSGDNTYSSTTTNVDTATVNPEAAVVAGSAANAAVGSNLYTIVTVRSASGVGQPAGTVTVYPYGTLIGSQGFTGTLAAGGTAGTSTVTIPVPASNAGTFAFQVNCVTDASFSCYQPASFPVTITKVTPTVTLVQTGTTAVTLTATVAAPSGSNSSAAVPTGSVQFIDGTTNLGSQTLNSSGVATYAGTLAGSTHSLTAQYLGDGNYASASSSSTNDSITSTLAASLSPTGSIPYGYNATVNATVTLRTGTSTGTVNVSVSGGNGTYSAPIATSTGSTSGTAAVSFPVPTPGTYTITTTCSTALNCAAQSLPLTTTKGYTTTTVNGVTPSSPQAGVPVQISATVANSGTGTGQYSYSGTVAFYANGKYLGSGTVSSGTALATVVFTTTSSLSVTAVYSGDVNWSGSTSQPITITPTPLPATIVLSSNYNSAIVGQNITLTAALSSSVTDTSLVPSGTVTFHDTYNGITVNLGTAASLSNGLNTAYAQISTTGLQAGSHDISAVYIGDSIFLKTTSSHVSINIGDFSVAFLPSSLYIAQGGTGTAVLTVSSVNNFNGPIALGCTPPPGELASCNVSPSLINAGGSATVTIVTTKNTPTSQLQGTSGVAAAASLGGLLSLLLVRRRRRVAALLLLLVMAMFMAGGCTQVATTDNSSSGSGSATGGDSNNGTPLGTVNFTITAASVSQPVNARHNFLLPVTVQ